MFDQGPVPYIHPDRMEQYWTLHVTGVHGSGEGLRAARRL